MQINAHLLSSPALAARVRRNPGLRVPGACDAFELAIRAVLGQQVSVAAATTLAGRLVERFGEPVEIGPELTHLFPRPEALADADVAAIGLPGARAATVRALAATVVNGSLHLDGACDLGESVKRLTALPGMGAWTAQYIAMRALAEPDAFPSGDLGLRRALSDGAGPIAAAALEHIAEEWRPWRAYAALHLWTGGEP
jgi:AraC family transcriptional regulator of adaptative response / DNA-3-methyladenine glycosylase II